MKSKEYILKELETLIIKFPHVRVRYEYDKYALVHFIEVIPSEVYHFDDEYIKWESDMDDKFIELFPTENICFISDDALVGIENAELILYGETFTQISTYNEEQKMIVSDGEFTSFSFPNVSASIKKEVETKIDYSLDICQTYSFAA